MAETTAREAMAFLDLLAKERPDLLDDGRHRQVRAAIQASGTYVQTTGELTYGAQVAWRNAIDCLGRPAWRSLIVRDERDVRRAGDLFDACVEHLAPRRTVGRCAPR